MKIVDYILEEISKNKSSNITNIIIQYDDLQGNDFFERLNHLKHILEDVKERRNVRLVEDVVYPKKHWKWFLPFYFDHKYKFIQFNLEKFEIENTNAINCGSIWRRPVDGTVIEIIAIEGEILYTRTLEGPGVAGDVLNKSVLRSFWNCKKS